MQAEWTTQRHYDILTEKEWKRNWCLYTGITDQGWLTDTMTCWGLFCYQSLPRHWKPWFYSPTQYLPSTNLHWQHDAGSSEACTVSFAQHTKTDNFYNKMNWFASVSASESSVFWYTMSHLWVFIWNTLTHTKMLIVIISNSFQGAIFKFYSSW